MQFEQLQKRSLKKKKIWDLNLFLLKTSWVFPMCTNRAMKPHLGAGLMLHV